MASFMDTAAVLRSRGRGSERVFERHRPQLLGRRLGVHIHFPLIVIESVVWEATPSGLIVAGRGSGRTDCASPCMLRRILGLSGRGNEKPSPPEACGDVP